tara:strand:- start:725 stop:967 length:243 start_codon:yes stop_codon:yes gene_type:complete
MDLFSGPNVKEARYNNNIFNRENLTEKEICKKYISSLTRYKPKKPNMKERFSKSCRSFCINKVVICGVVVGLSSIIYYLI